jgi:hypothetical protein
MVEPVASAVVGVPGRRRRAVSGPHTHTQAHVLGCSVALSCHCHCHCITALLHYCTAAWPCAVAWLPPHVASSLPHSLAAAPRPVSAQRCASHDMPRNCDLRRRGGGGCDWQNTAPARRRGYTSAGASTDCDSRLPDFQACWVYPPAVARPPCHSTQPTFMARHL